MNKKARMTYKKRRKDTLQQRLLLRLKCVKLIQNGKSASEVARLHGQSSRAVSYWAMRFKQHGIEGLKDARSRSGRKSRLDPSQTKTMEAFVMQSRKKSSPITGNLLSKYIKDTFGISLTVRQCERIIKRITI
jgi:transposase